MILQALAEYYENLARQKKVAESGWCQAKVSHAIELNIDGTIKTIVSLKKEVMRGKKSVMESEPLYVPQMVTRSSGINSNFLCDNAKYLMGIVDGGVTERSAECFYAAKEKHLSILKNAGGIMAQTICKYFENWKPEMVQENSEIKSHWEELNEGGNIIFSMKNVYAQEDNEIRNIWKSYCSQENNGQKGICLVTGEKTEISRIHRGIKGIPGAQSSGAALVSFNAPAFESYGKEQSYNAPVGKYAEFAYTTALNYLLGQKEYRFSLGDSMIVFWAESAKEIYQKTFLTWMNPKVDNQKEMQKVFGNLQRGIWVDIDDIKLDLNQKFYILGLAPNAARVSVRFFYQNSFGNILENIKQHYLRMEIVRPAWEEMEYLGVQKMLGETVNQKSKNKSPVSNMSTMVLKAILSNSNYPMSLYTDTIIRIRAEGGKITCGRAAIIKAFLIKNYEWKGGEEDMGLNEKCTESAYVLGRLFAVLESIQKDANPGINSTIRDRYFNSACATPATVFPVLIKLKNSHVKKLERESVGAKIYYEKLLSEIIEKVEMTEEKEGFPKRLSLEEQGKFMLGYYHQMQKKYEKREEK